MSGGPGVDETVGGGGVVVSAMTEPESEAVAGGYDPGPGDSLPATEPPDEAGEEDGDLLAVDAGGEGGWVASRVAVGAASVSDRQRLLSGVGFPIRVDGVSGPATTQAITWFQEAWTRSSLVIDGLWGPATEAAARQCVADGRRVSDHYALPEFACSHCHWPRANRALVRGLERLRAVHYTAGLQVVSAYRCKVHNDAIGGAKGSQHLYGRAANIPPRGDDAKLVTVEMVAALRLFGGLEYQPRVSGRGCTHVDVRAGGDPSSPNVFPWG